MHAPALLFNDRQYQSADGIVQLLTHARNGLNRSLDARLAEFGITHSQASILWMLSTGNFSTATDLARELAVDAASMTRMIDRLEKRKLVLRMPRGDDRRMISLRLTPAGNGLARQLPAIYGVVMNQNFAGFSMEDIALLRGLLDRLLGNVASHV